MEDHRLWPGKTSRTDPNEWHPATFHSLDVAAVAKQLLLSNPNWTSRLARSISINSESLSNLFIQFIALHDIGKLSESFCRMVGHDLPSRSANSKISHLRHWEISYQLLRGELDQSVTELTGVIRNEARTELYAAVAGHHGIPPKIDQNFSDLHGVAAGLEFVKDLARILPRTADLQFKTADAKRLSWSLAGLTVASDWIGSNTDWFKFSSPLTPVDEYWRNAQESAIVAVAEAGLAYSPISKESSLAHLFNIHKPRPMQICCASIELNQNPTLAVIEDATGSGKTEAAILLAHRMMRHSLGEGIYVALPTTATADAMFNRLSQAYRHLFASNKTPSIALAHGRRAFNNNFRKAIRLIGKSKNGQEKEKFDRAQSIENKDVSSFCSEWIASDQRKTFLAQVGVGTIDQAFFSILPVKHSVLRLFGLSQRVLIIDEAHACDPYMEEELCRLLEMQGLLQGSAIVMTATLTDRLRTKLVKHYRRGLGARGVVKPTGAYPLLSVVRADLEECAVQEVEAVGPAVRKLPVQRISSLDEAIDIVSRAALNGAAVAWIRNTVDDAISAHAALKKLGHDVKLFHARFALGDRLNIETTIVSQFGKASTGERVGCILVATQVVESSLDLDFDVMVSDLAPADALIQRAGRLWRHMDLRPSESRPVSDAVLHILSPDPMDVVDDKWGQDVFGGSGFVYGLPILWRTALAIFKSGEIAAPEGLSTLIEAALGDTPPVPPVWERIEGQLLGDQYADKALSKQNAVQPSAGYLDSRPVSSESSFPTRADLESRKVHLVRYCNSQDTIVPLVLDDDDGALSEVGLRERFYRRLDAGGCIVANEPRPAFAADWPLWRIEGLRMVLVSDDGRVGDVARYDAHTGLMIVPDNEP